MEFTSHSSEENSSDASAQELRSVVGIAVPAIALICIIILSILGNLAVIIAVLRTPCLREKPSSTFLISLSFADLMNGILVMPSSLAALLADGWRFGMTLCYIQCGLTYCFIIVSMVTLACISIDGYFAVKHPLRYHSIVTPRVTRVAVAYTWLKGLAFAAVPAINTWIVYDYWEVACAIEWDNDIYWKATRAYVLVAFILCFLSSICIMIFCYVHIGCAARTNSTWPLQQHSRRTHRQISKNLKVVQSLAIVVTIFFVCTAPFCFTKVLKMFLTSSYVPSYLNLIATWFSYISCATNPFIYGIFRKDFRRAFVKLFCRQTNAPVTHDRRRGNLTGTGRPDGGGRRGVGEINSLRVSSVSGQNNEDLFRTSSMF